MRDIWRLIKGRKSSFLYRELIAYDITEKHEVKVTSMSQSFAFHPQVRIFKMHSIHDMFSKDNHYRNHRIATCEPGKSPISYR